MSIQPAAEVSLQTLYLEGAKHLCRQTLIASISLFAAAVFTEGYKTFTAKDSVTLTERDIMFAKGFLVGCYFTMSGIGALTLSESPMLALISQMVVSNLFLKLFSV